MLQIALRVGWHTPPVLTDWNDRRPVGKFVRGNFYRWLISAGMDRSFGGGSSLLSWSLLGFYVTLFVTDFWDKR